MSERIITITTSDEEEKEVRAITQPCGFQCLHCRIEDTIDSHKWICLSEGQISRKILKDLLNVLFDFFVTRGFSLFWR